MMNENKKIELTELEMARIQGRIDALAVISALVGKGISEMINEIEQGGKKVPNGPGVAGLLVMAMMKAMEGKVNQALNEAGEKLSIELSKQITSSGVTSSSIRVNADRFRETLGCFITTPFVRQGERQ